MHVHSYLLDGLLGLWLNLLLATDQLFDLELSLLLEVTSQCYDLRSEKRRLMRVSSTCRTTPEGEL